MVKRILVPTDFSRSADRALAWVRQEFPTAHIKLLHVFDQSSFYSPDMDGVGFLGMLEDTVQALQEQVLEQLEGLQEKDEEVLLLSGRPVDVILEVVRDFRPDLVVMGTHGRNGFSHLVFGSVAEGVVRNSRVPVMVVREHTTVDV